MLVGRLSPRRKGARMVRNVGVGVRLPRSLRTTWVLSCLLWIVPRVALAVTDEKPADDDKPPDAATLLLISDGYEREGYEAEARRDWKECGRSMLAAAETLPAHPRHAQRLAKAAQCFQKARLVGQALRARFALISTHPQDPLVRDALFDIAAGYHQLAYYSKAMECYEAFAVTFPRDKRAAKALKNAKEFREGLQAEEGGAEG